MEKGFPIVAIGSSAGGHEALTDFFQNLPPEPNAAFVVISHLSPNYISNLHVILARVSPIPTGQIHSGQEIEINHLYVIPEGVIATINDGFFVLKKRTRVINQAVDDFFITLANDQKETSYRDCYVGPRKRRNKRR